MKLSFAKKETLNSKPTDPPKTKRSVAHWFGETETSRDEDTSQRPVRITSFARDDQKAATISLNGQAPKSNVTSAEGDKKGPKRPLLIYDPASLGKEAWLASQEEGDGSGSANEDELLGPDLSVTVSHGESMLAKAAKQRNLGQEPETVDYHKCAFEDYGRRMLLQMGLDPDSEDAVPDVAYKPRPYAQAGLGATELKLPTSTKEEPAPRQRGESSRQSRK